MVDDIVEVDGSRVRIIESQYDIKNTSVNYKLFEKPVEDMEYVEWWENHLTGINFKYTLGQVERITPSGKVKVLGYNIFTDKAVTKGYGCGA